MTEHFLDGTQVGPSVEEVCCEAVPKRMWTNFFHHVRLKSMFVDHPGDASWSEVAAEAVQKKMRVFSGLGKFGKTAAEVFFNHAFGWRRKGDDPLFSAFSEDAKCSVSEVDGGDIECCQLRNAQSASVKDFKNGAVPGAKQGIARSAKKMLGLGSAQNMGQRSNGSGCVDGLHGIA